MGVYAWNKYLISYILYLAQFILLLFNIVKCQFSFRPLYKNYIYNLVL